MTSQPEGWTIWACPACGEEVPDDYGPPMLPGRGHYHDNPENPGLRRIFHPAREIEVVPASLLDQERARVGELEEKRRRQVEGLLDSIAKEKTRAEQAEAAQKVVQEGDLLNEGARALLIDALDDALAPFLEEGEQGR